MLNEQQSADLNRLMVSSLSKAEGWDTMLNNIERYQKIKSLSIDSFKAILDLMPHQVRLTVQHKITVLEESEPIFEHEELLSFLKLAQIYSTGLLSSLDEKNIPDYAAPHQAAGILDTLLRHCDNERYSENNVSEMGASFSLELIGLKGRLEKIDWKKGWD